MDSGTLVQKADYSRNISEIKKKTLDFDYTKYITKQEFNKLTADNFAAILAQAKLVTKDDIADFVKETDFDKKLKNINKKVASNNKTKHVLVENEPDKLSKKVELISIKGLTKDFKKI